MASGQIFSFGILLVTFLNIPTNVNGHARLMEPPSRASMWRQGFNNPADYNDNQGFCGGFQHQFGEMGGKCGICGDPWDAKPRQHEVGGRFANGVLVKSYEAGQVIDVTIQVTANHKGYFEFKLCENNNPSSDPTQECFDKTVVKVFPTMEDKYYVPTPENKPFDLQLKLPDQVQCSQCILQWTYISGNNWGTCPDGSGALGCGPQEHFRACADIAIVGSCSGTTASPHSTTTTTGTDDETSTSTSMSTTEEKTSTVIFNDSTTEKVEGNCHAQPPNDNDESWNEWCNNNCNAVYPYCPEQFCICDTSNMDN